MNKLLYYIRLIHKKQLSKKNNCVRYLDMNHKRVMVYKRECNINRVS